MAPMYQGCNSLEPYSEDNEESKFSFLPPKILADETNPYSGSREEKRENQLQL
jgi:hypothetical protein